MKSSAACPTTDYGELGYHDTVLVLDTKYTENPLDNFVLSFPHIGRRLITRATVDDFSRKTRQLNNKLYMLYLG